MSDKDSKSWAGIGAELFDLLTGRKAEIIYNLDNMEVQIPAHATPAGTASSFAQWKFNGAVRISSRTLEEK